MSLSKVKESHASVLGYLDINLVSKNPDKECADGGEGAISCSIIGNYSCTVTCKDDFMPAVTKPI